MITSSLKIFLSKDEFDEEKQKHNDAADNSYFNLNYYGLCKKPKE